jgi:hypothetical protein
MSEASITDKAVKELKVMIGGKAIKIGIKERR